MPGALEEGQEGLSVKGREMHPIRAKRGRGAEVGEFGFRQPSVGGAFRFPSIQQVLPRLRSEVSLFPFSMGRWLPIRFDENQPSPVYAELARFLLYTAATPRFTPGGRTERNKRKPTPRRSAGDASSEPVKAGPQNKPVQPSPRENRASSPETVQTATDPDAEQSLEVQRGHPMETSNERTRTGRQGSR